MKKCLLIATILFTQLSILEAQDFDPDHLKQEKIKALYVAFVTQQLNLTSQEAQQFWPVHTQFLNEIKQLNPNMPELDKQQKVLDIKRKYQPGFSKILGDTRTDEFFRINAAFKKKLLERIKNQRVRSNNRRGM